MKALNYVLHFKKPGLKTEEIRILKQNRFKIWCTTSTLIETEVLVDVTEVGLLNEPKNFIGLLKGSFGLNKTVSLDIIN